MADILNIEDGVLEKCTDKSVTSVTIPEGVTEIGWEAFYGCTSLSSVVIPEGVSKIGGDAFRGCESLSSVEIPSSVTEIGGDAFKGCNINELSHPCLTIKGGLVVEESKLLYCASQSSSITIPEGVTEISGRLGEKGAFAGCSSLASVVIPPSVTKIGWGAFDGCKSLSSVSIPSSVTKIGGSAFAGCESLAKVTLGDDFKKVPSEWFDDLNRANPNYEIVCTEGSSTYKAIKRSSKLKLHHKSLNVTKEDLELQKAKNKKIAEVRKAGVDAILPMVLEGVADSSFSLLSNTKSATVAIVQIAENNAVFKLGADSSKWMDKAKKAAEILSDSAKSGREIYDALLQTKLPLAEIPAKKAENLTLKAGADKTVRLFCKGEVKAYGGVWQRHPIFPKDVRSAELFGVTAIGERAFIGCTALASVVIPESVTAIGERAFDGRKALASVVIPASVTKIGWHVFEGCTSLTSVVIPESVTEIGWYAFDGCKSLASVEFGGTVAQWEAVEKGDFWHKDVPAKSVKCADGEARL